jgi:hypothetical protein
VQVWAWRITEVMLRGLVVLSELGMAAGEISSQSHGGASHVTNTYS